MAEPSEVQKWEIFYNKIRDPSRSLINSTNYVRGGVFPEVMIFAYKHQVDNPQTLDDFSDSYAEISVRSSIEKKSGQDSFDELYYRVEGTEILDGDEDSPEYQLILPSRDIRLMVASLHMLGAYPFNRFGSFDGDYRPANLPENIRRRIADPISENILSLKNN
jgi:hypothetical protein